MNQPHLPFASDAVTLARRIEEASLNAWPALQQTFMDGWVLRFSRGFTKRSNSIVPLYPSRVGQGGFAEKIRYCENLYAREQLQTVFRLTSVADDGAVAQLDRELEQRGYVLTDTSLVLSAPLPGPGPRTDIDLLALDSWLNAYCQLTGMPEPARSLHGLILNSIAGECGFGVVRAGAGNQPVACGLAVVERELVGLFDIYTGDAHRGAGNGTTMVEGLLAWAAGKGAERAYLQMVEDNAPARALYDRLGFKEIYRYWYRVSP